MPFPLESNGLTACPNCDAPLAGKYCPSCGQKNDRLRMPARAVVSDLAESFLKFDKRLFATVRALLVPGQLTRDHFAGKRARYPRPLTLFLLCASLEFFVWVPKSQQAVAATLTEPTSEPHVEGRPDLDQKLKSFQTAMRDPQTVVELATRLQSPKVQFLLQLIFVLCLTVVLRRYYFSEHLVFALHVGAFTNLLDAGAILLHAERVAGLIQLVYLVVAFARVYQLGVLQTLLRLVLTAVLVVLVFSVLGTAAFAAWLAFG